MKPSLTATVSTIMNTATAFETVDIPMNSLFRLSSLKTLPPAKDGTPMWRFSVEYAGVIVGGFRINKGLIFPPSTGGRRGKGSPAYFRQVTLRKAVATALYRLVEESFGEKLGNDALKPLETAITPLLLTDGEYRRTFEETAPAKEVNYV